MSRSETSREVSVTTSSRSTSSGPLAGPVDERAAVRRDQAVDSRRDLGSDQAELLELRDDQLRALLGLVLLGVDHELRVRRLLVRIVDAGEAP